MKKILVLTPYARDPNSFWRCMGPLTYLAKHCGNDIAIHHYSEVRTQGISWPEINQYDLVFLHRPCTKDDLIIIQICHNFNIPVWIDLDDWLFELPSWNPNGFYNLTETQNYVAHCLTFADVVTCSTQELANQFSKVNQNVVILPNAYRSDLFTYRKEKLEERKEIILWRGSNTHDGDLLSVREGFQNLNAKVHFLGGASWLLTSGMKPGSFQNVSSIDFILYNRHIYDLKPKVMVFPLVDCLFNRCKSNIAYIEAMHAGAICVAPSMPEWRKPGVITYEPHSSSSFADAVNWALQIPQEEHEELLKVGFEEMKKNYDIEVINQKRLQLIYHIFSKDFKKNETNPFDQLKGLSSLSLLKSKEAPHA